MIRSLARDLWNRGQADERGAVLVFVAVAMVALLGSVAMSVDFGRIYSERRELQNGADAAALAVAQDCASGECNAGYDETAVAEQYADANASDGAALVEEIDLGSDQVLVRTATWEAGGDGVLDMMFAQVVGFDGLTVRAEATAEWGPPKELTVMPIAFAACEWDNIRASMHPAAEVHDGTLPDASIPQRVLGMNASGEPVECPLGSGLDGGFVRIGSGCSLDAEVGENLGKSGLSICLSESSLGEILLVPVFEHEIDSDEYHVAGFGALLLTAYDLKADGSEGKSLDGPFGPCHDDVGKRRECIEGYVIDWLVPGDEIAGSDFGVDVAKFKG